MESFSPELNRSVKIPLYKQLYSYIITELREGRIKGGERLPSKRRLAQDLGVSLNTVETTYQMLLSEGYIESKERSGFYASKLSGMLPIEQRAKAPAADSYAPKEWLYDLGTARVDSGAFPVKTWNRLYRRALSERPDLLNLGRRQGEPELCQAVCDYLHDYRAVSCAPDQIVVGAGMEYLLGILSCLLSGSKLALESPGYPKTMEIVGNQGLECVHIPVDRFGMSVERLEASGADAAYITPSHQFPSGVVMPASRREAILMWAGGAEGRYIIEDDYDSEFRFDRYPIPSLQSLDSDGKVVYMGTFSRSLAPGIRVGYMVLPEKLKDEFNRKFSHYNSTVSRFDQITLAAFLSEGYFGRHLNRIRKSYKERRDTLVGALSDAFGPKVSISGSHTGLHFLARLKLDQSEDFLVRRAKEAGVNLEGYGKYFSDGLQYRPEKGVCTLVMGYGDLPCEKAQDAVRLLERTWRE